MPAIDSTTFNGSRPPLPALPKVDADDTYLWTDVQKVRKDAKAQTLTAGQALPTITQGLASTDVDGNPCVLTFRVEASPKWFGMLSSEVNEKTENVVKLALVPNKTTATGRVVRVWTYVGVGGVPGSDKVVETFYLVTSGTK